MITQYGIVMETKNGEAVVHVHRSAGCGSCGSSCGHASETESVVMTVTVQNEIGAKTGDNVELSLGSGKLIQMSALTYLMPLAFLFIGAFAGGPFSKTIGWPSDPDLAAAFFGFVFLSLSFFGLWVLMKRKKSAARITPSITKINPKGNGTLEQCNIHEQLHGASNLGRLGIKLDLHKED